MAVIDPPSSIADITHLMLESYLSSITGIEDWVEGFTQILGIQDDDSLLFAASISPLSLADSEYALRKSWSTRSQWVIQLNFSTNEIRRALFYAHKWARYLSILLESTTSLSGMARFGADMSGTFEDVDVPETATLNIQDRTPWTIGCSDNGEGGAVVSIRCTITVVNP